MKKFKVTILVEDDGQDKANFYSTDSLRIDLIGLGLKQGLNQLDLNLIQIDVEEL